MNTALWLERTAGKTPEAPAIFLGTTLVADYASFHRQAGQLAAWLIARGVHSGDRVGLFAKNAPEYLIALYGIWYAGAAAVPINAKLHGREAAWIIGDADVKLTLTNADLAEALKIADVSCEIVEMQSRDYAAIFDAPPIGKVALQDPGDLAWLFYTSGTTGKPKGVMITHRMLSIMTLAYLADVDAVSADHATLYAAPMSHAAGLYMLVHVMMGARHICPDSGQFDPGEILELARDAGQVHLFAAPTMIKRLTLTAKAAAAHGEGLRIIVYAGGPMYNADIIEAVDQFGPIFAQIYGQGECPMAITALSRHDVADRSHPRWRERLGSVGRAQAGSVVQIGDAQAQVLPVGETGEIMVRGDAVMPGYWRNDAATAKTLVHGWLMTGDVGYLDQDGYLTLQDRSKDMIISGGSNIYPREVEEVLVQHPSLQEVSVVGRENAEWGEDVVAFVVLAEGATLKPEDLSAHCLEHIARFKRPKAYFEVSELPKNNYGKVLKAELRERLKDH